MSSIALAEAGGKPSTRFPAGGLVEHVQHGKQYEAEEYRRREAIFEANVAKINAHNEEYHSGKQTWYASINHLTDFTPEEFARLRSTKYSPSNHPTVMLSANAPNPDSIDWREKKAVTAVKNQGGCGSCWAFSATETVESAYAIASGKLLELAPQTYVNCVKNPNKCGGTGGCEGATMELAFNLTAQTGIALESTLPYAGRDETCSDYKAAVKVSGYVKNPVNDANALETAVATKGPQAITVAAEPWQFYGGGVFHGCSSGLFSGSGATLDHGVQAVGYAKDYWIVRNSWSPSFGEEGYIYLEYGKNTCGIANEATLVNLAGEDAPEAQARFEHHRRLAVGAGGVALQLALCCSVGVAGPCCADSGPRSWSRGTT